MSGLAATIICSAALTVPVIAAFADRNAEAAALLAGLVAVAGVMAAAALLAETLAQPLARMADAVQALACGANVGPSPSSGTEIATAGKPAGQSCIAGGRITVATAESSGDIVCMADHPVAPDRQEPHQRHAPTDAIGSRVDILIPSDRRCW